MHPDLTGSQIEKVGIFSREFAPLNARIQSDTDSNDQSHAMFSKNHHPALPTQMWFLAVVR